MDYGEIISNCYCGDGPEKLEKAFALSRQYAEVLLQDAAIISQLEKMRTAAGSLDSHMAEMEMGKSCSHCAATPKGGCCSEYMGNENNDALLLLMNILAGVQVRVVANAEGECCFLGERGCLLLFKPIFCLNYLCERIQRESGAEALLTLERRTGDLLRAQVELEQRLINFLQRGIVKSGG
ncbi:MAG: hypothetical protein ABFR63_05905 [Thermodesulfobacteriota bacterium]